MSSWDTTNVSQVRRLVLPLLVFLVWTGAAHAETVFTGPVTDARLALDRSGDPVVAYAIWLPSRKTYLRLVRTDASFGRLVTTRITRGGFPSTATLPGAAPVVLPSGRIRVVETYLPAAIEWHPIPG